MPFGAFGKNPAPADQMPASPSMDGPPEGGGHPPMPGGRHRMGGGPAGGGMAPWQRGVVPQDLGAFGMARPQLGETPRPSLAPSVPGVATGIDPFTQASNMPSVAPIDLSAPQAPVAVAPPPTSVQPASSGKGSGGFFSQNRSPPL